MTRKKLARITMGVVALLMGPFGASGADKGTAAEEAEAPEIRWYYQSFPPAHIAEGPGKGEGFADKALAALQARMPGYRHTNVFVSHNRVLGEVRARENACHFGLFRTPEREEFALFSAPFIEVLPNRLILLKDHQDLMVPYLSPEGEIDLALLGKNEALVAGSEGSRFYSPGINAFLQDATAPHRVVRMPDPHFAALLIRGRIDYAFGFAFEATYRFRALGAEDTFVSLPVKDEPALLYNQVGCNKSAFGAEVIAAVNALVPVLTEEHRAFYAEWLDERAREDFAKALERAPANGADRAPAHR